MGSTVVAETFLLRLQV